MGIDADPNPRPEESIRRVAQHVEAMRRRLREGAVEIARQRGSVADLAEHANGISRWIEETERQLDAARTRPRNAQQ